MHMASTCGIRQASFRTRWLGFGIDGAEVAPGRLLLLHALSLASPRLATHTARPCSPAAGSTNGAAAAVQCSCELLGFSSTTVVVMVERKTEAWAMITRATRTPASLAIVIFDVVIEANL
ncbi:hypothetical protein Acr_28g0000420 [Actinidia rufa]|uniref:Uncharacterized protein n=1 Tax=Actinidia rufa TaxID=165716 RepID=A0A7J0H8A6_9ERIC|nr:hypothetical protein Acr_28g0000420 [Actinidia rufa]